MWVRVPPPVPSHQNRELTPDFCVKGQYSTRAEQMRRLIGSVLIAIILGIVLGVYLGWEQFPVQLTNSAMCQLSETHREDYTLMIARGYQSDRDRDAALQRLLPLSASNAEACLRDETTTQINNIPAWVQEVTERYLTRGADLQDICHLAALSSALGRQIPNYADRPGTVCDQFIS